MPLTTRDGNDDAPIDLGSAGVTLRWAEIDQPTNVAVEAPKVNFVRPCNLCPYMKRITLPKILDSLVFMKDEVTIDPSVADKARRAVAHQRAAEIAATRVKRPSGRPRRVSGPTA